MYGPICVHVHTCHTYVMYKPIVVSGYIEDVMVLISRNLVKPVKECLEEIKFIFPMGMWSHFFPLHTLL